MALSTCMLFLTFLVGSCYSASLEYAYSFHFEKSSWEDARKTCKAEGGRLAIIDSAEENEFITNSIFERESFGGFWIGLNDQATEGSWVWADDGGYSNFRAEEPNGGSKENCVEIISGNLYGRDYNGQWNDEQCSMAIPSICRKRKTTPNFGYEYKINKDAMPFAEAEEKCKAWGGHLATIGNAIENAFLKEQLEKNGVNAAWIGYSDRVTEGTFTWIVPQGHSYRYFRAGEPNGQQKENCGEIIADRKHGIDWNGKWNDEDCEKTLNFICRKFNYKPASGDEIKEVKNANEDTDYAKKDSKNEVSLEYTYSFQTDKSSWEDARKTCKAEGGRLAIIDSAEENGLIANAIAGKGGYWIGLNDRATEGSFVWADDEGYSNFRAGEPNGGSTDNCVEFIPGNKWGIGYNGQWNDIKCSEDMPSICRKSKTTPNFGYIYKINKDAMPEAEAEEKCKAWGGHLATIGTAIENAFLKEQLEKNNINSAWIGYSDKETEGTFTWIVPQGHGYRNFRTGEPNGQQQENCGEILDDRKHGIDWNGKWNDENCDKTLNFICRKFNYKHARDMAYQNEDVEYATKDTEYPEEIYEDEPEYEDYYVYDY